MGAVKEVTCDFCRLPIRSGEEHGIFQSGGWTDHPDGSRTLAEPTVICRIKKIVQAVEEVVTVQGVAI